MCKSDLLTSFLVSIVIFNACVICFYAKFYNKKAFISTFNRRSRSPMDIRKHRSKYRESDRSSPHRHRDHSSHQRNDPDYDKLYKDKHARREERKSTSHSYSPDRRHDHGYSHIKSRP